MEHCELVPGRGIRRGTDNIFFGTPRATLRKLLGKPKPPTNSMWDDEDEYDAYGKEWLRLRYLDEKLCDIEVLGGKLVHEGLELKDTDFRTLRDGLHNSGIAIHDETEWLSEGRDCIDLQIVIATRDDVDDLDDDDDEGVDVDGAADERGSRIAWVIASVDFKVVEE
ncbi:MAG: hypothetical protein WBW32_13695 [Luteibacter sp.]